MHVRHDFVHVSEELCLCSQFTVALHRSSKPRRCIHRHVRAKPARLSAVLCRAVPVWASLLPQPTSGGALGQGSARLGEMPEELLSALSRWVEEGQSAFGSEHVEQPRLGWEKSHCEATLEGGHLTVPSRVQSRLVWGTSRRASRFGCQWQSWVPGGGDTITSLCLKRIAGELREAIGNVAAKKWFGFCPSLKVRSPGSR